MRRIGRIVSWISQVVGRPLALLAGRWALLLCPAAVAAAELHETFAGRSFERDRWTVDRRNPPGVKVDFGRETLHLAIPPGPAGRPPASLRARFGLEGDFDVRAQYRLAAVLPRPAEDWINIDIFVQGEDGAAAVIRTSHATEGSGYTLWFEPSAARGGRGAWKQVPTRDLAGTLRLRRAGQELEFWASGAGEDLRRLGAVAFGAGPIRVLELRLTVPALRAAVAVDFDDVAITADRLIEPPRPAGALAGPGLVRGAAAVAGLVAVVGFTALLWKRRSRLGSPG